jgi:zinc metalloprotease ZmpB
MPAQRIHGDTASRAGRNRGRHADDYFFGNPRSGELHVSSCPFWPHMNTARLQAFETAADAVARGYNGCFFCLPEHDTG